MVDENFKKAVRKQYQDLGMALIILAKDALFALAVLLVAHGLAWTMRWFSGEGDAAASVVRYISDVGSLVLYLTLVCKDLWVYLSRK